jgi:hypothetical protein
VTLSLQQLDEARRDPLVFARLVIGEPLWAHQEAVVRSSAVYRVICAGRRAGKTRVFGTLALHQGVAVQESQVLIVSATDRSSKRMLKDIAGMAARAELLRDTVDDESTSKLLLSNGSLIECVPASMGAVRSAEADLLIVDEAGFVDQSIWEAAEPTVISRPGSRVLICSTPWGAPDHFFRSLWEQGMLTPDEEVESWHWPSSISPLVSEERLERLRERNSAEYFEREYLAIFGDVSGQYFAGADLDAAVDERPMLVPVGRPPAVGGADWGQARDASTLVVVVTDGDATEARGDGRSVYRVVLARSWDRAPYHEVIADMVGVAAGFEFWSLVTETNGVGAMPSEELRRALVAAGLGDPVAPVVTTLKSKADGFGLLRMLLQQRRLLLPQEAVGLLKELRALRFEQLPAGGVRISVPESVGHDDLAMGLCLAALQLLEYELPQAVSTVVTMDDFLGEDLTVRIGPDV